MKKLAPFKTMTLTEMRKQEMMTQEELAEILDIHRTTLNRYEKGSLTAPKSILCMAAMHLGYPPTQIAGYIE